ncbi:hypothetical protein F443_01858 [Phytophthora nicotianae P1569]|uniref:BZIP domain-containing protein n=2 Tax=Phytophthora nicotianae TaxID=4792 RepID=V9FWJ8_PHYNI|nr:hypothetical protein F443_01858 [Phytophthora nicotianae P1569]
MASSLYPPTKYSFTDVVIGDVMDRVAPQYSGTETSFLADSLSLGWPSVTEMISANQHQFPPRGFEDLATEDTKASRLFQERSKTAIRREKSRLHQARYRIRKREHVKSVTASVCRLSEDIQILEARRHALANQSTFCSSVWSVAGEYFRLFQRGYKESLQVPSAGDQTLAAVEERPHQPHAQIDFLRETMAHDMTDGVVCGVEALLQNWKLLSFYHGDLYVQLQRLDHVTKDSLQATITVSLTITESTLQNLYPHLLDSTARDIDDGQRPSLAAKLLNQRIVVHGSVRFDWDEANSRVMRLESKLDLLSPILELLGSLEAVALVFNSALVTPEGRLLSNDLSAS